jgi:DNA polymerase III subunit epsilon
MISRLAQLLNLDRPLVDLDLETTGIFPKRDRIVQIGIIKFYPNGDVTEWETLVNPGIPIDPEASAVHKITDEMVQDAPTFCSLSEKLFVGLHECDVLGYNLKAFDIPFLQEEFARCNRVWKEPRVVDVFKLYQRVSPRNLTAAVKEFLGETFEAAHDALSDVRATARVLEAMLEAHQEIPRDVQGIHDLLFKATNGLDAQGKFAWKGAEVVVNFGKWQGKPLRDARSCSCRGRCQCLRGYLEWMIKSDFPDDTKTIARNALAGTFPTKG